MTATEVRHGTATANGIEIAYEDMGDVNDPPVLLIMGFASQLTVWPVGFCDLLVDAGYRVIRFDNRDIGLSTSFDGVRAEGSMLLRMARHELGLSSTVPYTVRDMAEDARGLLDALDIDSAHIIGASMGGMIAQVLAGQHPDYVRSVGILFSSTNQPFLPPPHPAALLGMISGPGPHPTRAQVIANAVKGAQVIGSPGYPTPLTELETAIAADYDRSYRPAGIVRQWAAITGSGSLLPYTKRLDKPTVVIHGAKDRLIRPAGGKAVAKAVRGADLHIIDGMGHDLPTQLHSRLTDLLIANFARA